MKSTIIKNILNQNRNHDFLKELSEEGIRELLLAYESSKDEKNLIDNEQVMETIKKWEKRYDGKKKLKKI